MNEEHQFTGKIGQLLDTGTQSLDRRVTERLHLARQAALSHQREVPVAGLRLAGAGFGSLVIPKSVRTMLAIVALCIGVVATYATTTYWQQFERAAEMAEIDGALLADEIPFNAYLDQDFLEWLDHLAQDDSSQG